MTDRPPDFGLLENHGLRQNVERRHLMPLTILPVPPDTLTDVLQVEVRRDDEPPVRLNLGLGQAVEFAKAIIWAAGRIEENRQ